MQEDGKAVAAMALGNNSQSVLVVDDSRVVRVSVSRVLEQEYQVHQAEDGELGLAAAQRLQPDLVISDINMPNLDGYGLICRLRGTDRLSDVPIIVITSAEEDIVRERAYACGANAFILKPFDASQLLRSVRAHLNDFDASADELSAKYGSHIEDVIVSDVAPMPED